MRLLSTSLSRFRSTYLPLALVSCLSLAWTGCGRDPEQAKQEYVQRGDEFARSEKYAEAILEYRNAIQIDPLFGHARLKLAETYALAGDQLNTYREYIRTADLMPDNVEVQLKTAEVLLSAGSFTDAEARAMRVLAKQPGHIEAQIIRANALAGLNQMDDAIREIESSIKEAPDRPAAYGTLGAIQLARGDVARAREAFQKAVETDPKSIEARVALAGFYWRSADQREAAAAQFQAAVALDPTNLLANRALATFYVSSGRAAEAEPFFKAVAQADPGRGTLALADYYSATNRPREARPVYEELAKNQVYYSTATLRLAVLGLYAGDRTTAAKLVDEVLAKVPADLDALVVKAQLLANERKLDEALAVANRAIEVNAQSARAYYTLGRIQTARYLDAEASAALSQAIALNPRYTAAILEQARLRMRARNFDEAQQLAQTAQRLNPSDPNVHLVLARVNLTRGNRGEAERIVRQLAAAFPRDPAVQLEMGMLEFARGSREPARRAFEAVIASDPVNADAVAGLAQLHIQAGRPVEAKAVVNAALAKNQTDPRLLLVATRVYAATGDIPAAERMLRRIIETDPRNPEAYAALGGLYASQNRLADALAEYQALAERQPRNVAAHTAVAVVLGLMKRTAEARQQYERTLAIDSTAAIPSNNLAWLYLESGENLDLALQLAQTAKAQLPNSPGVNDTLGWAYLKKGLARQAIAPLQLAVQLEPDNALFHSHLGEAYSTLGDTGKARQALSRALAIDPSFEGVSRTKELIAALN